MVTKKATFSKKNITKNYNLTLFDCLIKHNYLIKIKIKHILTFFTCFCFFLGECPLPSIFIFSIGRPHRYKIMPTPLLLSHK